MAFKIKNHALDGVLQSDGFRHLTSSSLPARISYPLALLAQDLRGKMQVLGEEQRKVAEKFCDRDESGKPKRRPNGGYVVTERFDEFQPEFEDLMSQETEIAGDKLSVDLEMLNDALEKPLTAMQIVELTPIIDFIFNGEQKEGK